MFLTDSSLMGTGKPPLNEGCLSVAQWQQVISYGCCLTDDPVGVPGRDDKLTLPLFELPIMEKNVLGCYYGSGDMRIELKTLLELFKNGRLKIDELITSRYSLEEINVGFKDLESGKNARGVVIY